MGRSATRNPAPQRRTTVPERAPTVGTAGGSQMSTLRKGGVASRRRLVGVTVLAIVVAAGGGWLAGSRIQSPAEIAAQTAPPEPSPILVPAELRVLATNVVTRGTGRFGAPRELTTAPSPFKPSLQVATEIAPVGTELAEDDALMSVNGRHVILLEGALPSFRDLGIGVTGNDVAQLEAALQRLGHDPGPVDGVFDAATEVAVIAWYESRGESPIVVSAEQMEALLPPELLVIPSGAPSAGVVVPADEIVFLPDLPVRITEALIAVGEPIEGSVAMVSDTSVAIDGSLPIEQAGLVETGMTVSIDEPDLGISAAGVVSRIASGPGTDGLDGFHVYFEVTVDDAPPALINASVRLTIPIETTDRRVLAVPVTALTTGGDGTTRVHRSNGTDFDVITVDPGLSAQGYVEVTPIDNDLAPGDMVLIGFDNGAAGG